MKPIQSLAGLLAAAALTSVASAQGATCAAAVPISGLGAFAFNNLGATTDGPTSCGAMEADVWFSWTAPSTDSFLFSTCDTADYDTVLAAYSGSCGSLLQVGCNDDDSSCSGFTSIMDFNAIGGQSYLIQIGGWQGDTGSGTLNVSIDITGGVDDCTPPASGPDVIVGSLNGLQNYTGQGGIGGYAIGTTSCNVGDAELDWIAGNTNHPVIGQNIYRHEGNRFELLGISWLKHGFTALQQDLCCDCNSSGTGSRLGVGCSDPYGASLNGSQSGLGPRFQVNAHTGAFSYPYFAQGSTGNSIFKRIQVANSDLDPSAHPTASYFGEGHYVTPDDAAAGNQNNNASYRAIDVGSFSNGRWTLSLSGPTVRKQPAIRAWEVMDSNVELVDVQVPNEGLFIVGNNATDNGDGTWHYEYAVHNLNSHASGGSFSVPVPAGVAVTNIGFHDVDYHSGEPYDGTNWPGVRNANDVTWSTDSFASNANANAIRWGTLYNFRFDADAPPSASSATLGLWRPNTPQSVSVAVRAPECAGVTATQAMRAGSPANPMVLMPGSNAPLVGSVWNPSIDHSTFYLDAAADVLAINPDGVQINAPIALGTLLCNPPLAPDFYFLAATGTPFSVAIPAGCDLVGLPVCSQGASIGGSQGIKLTNALDITIGNM